jgi:hypothetical protein
VAKDRWIGIEDVLKIVKGGGPAPPEPTPERQQDSGQDEVKEPDDPQVSAQKRKAENAAVFDEWPCIAAALTASWIVCWTSSRPESELVRE